MIFDVKLIFIITAYVVFDTTYAGVCPVIPPFVGDLCGDMPNTQKDQSVFLKNSRFDRDARCQCDVKMASPGPTPETLRIILLSSRVDGSYCPGMNMSVESRGRVLMAIDCSQAVHFIPISNPQQGFEIKSRNLQQPGAVKSSICLSVSAHVALTVRCSRIPILAAKANVPTTDLLTSLAPSGVMNLNGVSTPPPAPTNYFAAVKQHNATGTQSQSILAASQGAPATVQPDLGTTPPSQVSTPFTPQRYLSIARPSYPAISVQTRTRRNAVPFKLGHPFVIPEHRRRLAKQLLTTTPSVQPVTVSPVTPFDIGRPFIHRVTQPSLKVKPENVQTTSEVTPRRSPTTIHSHSTTPQSVTKNDSNISGFDTNEIPATTNCPINTQPRLPTDRPAGKSSKSAAVLPSVLALISLLCLAIA